MKKLCIWLLLITLIGCKELGTISEVKKTVVFPGVPQGNKTVKYIAKLNLKKTVFIKNIIVEVNNKNINLKEYRIIDLKTDKNVADNSLLIPGEYYFESEIISTEELENSKDKLKFEFVEKGSNKRIVIKKDVNNIAPEMGI